MSRLGEAPALPEASILAFGRMHVGDYLALEYAGSLWRAFIRDRADYIILDSNMRGQRFLAACVAYAIDRGWLQHTRTNDYGQSESYEFRLTPQGRAALEKLRP